MLFELIYHLVDTVLGTYLVIHVLFDPVEPDQVEPVSFAFL